MTSTEINDAVDHEIYDAVDQTIKAIKSGEEATTHISNNAGVNFCCDCGGCANDAAESMPDYRNATLEALKLETEKLMAEALNRINQIRAALDKPPLDDFRPASRGVSFNDCLVGQAFDGNARVSIYAVGMDPVIKAIESRFENSQLPERYYLN